MNVLIASCGTRNKIVQYFKRALEGGRKGRVIATDCSPNAPALYEADAWYIVPRTTEPDYLDHLYEICRKEKITGVLSLIDPELSLLALHRREFEALGVTVIGSSYELCERTLNKWEMYQWLTGHGYRCARSYMDVEAFVADVRAGLLSYPVFVKPARGSASIAISKAFDEETVRLLVSHGEEMMIQEYLDGQEIGADCYIDLCSGQTVSIFTKKKLVMRAGETDKGISFWDERLFELIRRFIAESGFLGQIDIDVTAGKDFPHKRVMELINEESSLNNVKSNVSIGTSKKAQEKWENNAETGESLTPLYSPNNVKITSSSSISPKLMLMVQSLIKIIIQVDYEKSVINKEDKSGNKEDKIFKLHIYYRFYLLY